jgi:hypothetical protein
MKGDKWTKSLVNSQLPVLWLSIYSRVEKIWRLKTPEHLSCWTVLYVHTRTIMGSQSGGQKRI